MLNKIIYVSVVCRRASGVRGDQSTQLMSFDPPLDQIYQQKSKPAKKATKPKATKPKKVIAFAL